MLARYKKFAVQHYHYCKDSTRTQEWDSIQYAIEPLNQLYGRTQVRDFGPLALKAIQQQMVTVGLSRGVINSRIAKLKRIFRWAVSEQLAPPSLVVGLGTVAGLQRGRTSARETDPVTPVADEVVEKTLPHLPDVVADMVRFQRLVGCRPGEVCILRPRDVDRSDEIWRYVPASHKMQHRDRQRVIFVGPKAKAVLAPYLLRDADAFCFSPEDTDRKRKAKLRARRKTSVQPSQVDRSKPSPKRKPGLRYNKSSYGCAILRRAFAAKASEQYGIDLLKRFLKECEVFTPLADVFAQCSEDGHKPENIGEILSESAKRLTAIGHLDLPKIKTIGEEWKEHETRLPEEVANRGDTSADKFRVRLRQQVIENSKTTKDPLGDAVLAISEARKPSTSKDPWGQSLSELMGSARVGYAPTAVLLYRPMNDHELQDYYDTVVTKEYSKKFRKNLAEIGIAPLMLILEKGRDGMIRGEWGVEFHFKKTQFRELEKGGGTQPIVIDPITEKLNNDLKQAAKENAGQPLLPSVGSGNKKTPKKSSKSTTKPGKPAVKASGKPNTHGFSGRGHFSGPAKPRGNRRGRHGGEIQVQVLHGCRSFLVGGECILRLGAVGCKQCGTMNGSVLDASGSAAFDDNGQPMLFFAKTPKKGPREQWAALPEDDELIRWRRVDIGLAPGRSGVPADIKPSWADMFVFKAGGQTFATFKSSDGLVCEAIAPDLLKWKVAGKAVGIAGECPNLFPLQGRHVLIRSTEPISYQVGQFDAARIAFKPGFESARVLDHGPGPEFAKWNRGLYGTTVFTDAKGRTILLGWVSGFKPRRGWNGCMSLPRILTLDGDELIQTPIPELAELRGKKGSADTCEIVAKFEPTGRYGLKFGSIQIVCDANKVNVAGTEVPGVRATKLQVFFDRSVIEVVVNDGRRTVTKVAYPGSNRLSIEAFGKVESMEAWELKPVW